jgi:hypothetical protein
MVTSYLLLWLAASQVSTTEPGRPTVPSPPMVGVKIYETKRPARDLFQEWRELGINTVFASVALNRDPGFREEARRAGIARFVILPIFFDPDALEADPDLYAITAEGNRAVDEWVEFVCPSREAFRRRKVEFIKEVLKDADPEGLSLDFIRHFVFWEKVYPDRDPASLPRACFDRSCLEAFQKATGVVLPAGLETPRQAAAYLTTRHRDAWLGWRCELVTSMVRQVALEARSLKSGVQINVHLVPWRRDDFAGALHGIAGQDLAGISAHADYISPMTYAHMLKRPPSWVHSVVADVAAQTKRPVVPSIQVGKAYLETPLSNDEFAEALRQALAPPSGGVVFWSWQALEDEPEKKAVLRRLVKR